MSQVKITVLQLCKDELKRDGLSDGSLLPFSDFWLFCYLIQHISLFQLINLLRVSEVSTEGSALKDFT